MQTKVSRKSNVLVLTLQEHFGGKMNLAGIKFISSFILALCKVRTVTFEKLANAFDTPVKAEYSLRRMQRFIRSYDLNLDFIALLIFKLIPNNDKVSLTIDRTNWKFGALNINIFMSGIVNEGVAFPLMFSMLPKQGNSNSQDGVTKLEYTCTISDQ